MMSLSFYFTAAEKLFAEIKNSEDSNDKLLFFGYHQLLAGYNRSGEY